MLYILGKVGSFLAQKSHLLITFRNGGSTNGQQPSKKAKIVGIPSSYSDKNPVMILNELRTGLKYDCTESGDTPTTKRYGYTKKLN